MTRPRLLAIAALALLCPALPSHAAVTALKGAALIDGTGGDPVRPAIILVQDGVITAAGSRVEIPAGAEVIELPGATFLPGFIDCHVHLPMRTIGEGYNWEDSAVRDLPQELAIRGVLHARLTLEAGFTTVRNVGAADFSDVALRNMINQGVVPGPRILAAGHALGITGGHCDTNGYVPGLFEPDIARGIANGIDGVISAVRYQVKYGADVIKVCATGGVLSEGDAVGVQQYSFEELKALVDAAHMTERKVAAHAHGNEGIKEAVKAGVDSIEHGSTLDDEAISLMKQHGTWLVPTLMAQESVEKSANEGVLTGLRKEKALFIAPIARASFRKAAASGVKIALGTDAGVFPHGRNGHEFTLMVRNGMTPARAIVAGTSGAAELLGLSKVIGQLKAGLRADIVAVAGDPLADITLLERVSFVMQDGKVIRK